MGAGWRAVLPQAPDRRAFHARNAERFATANALSSIHATFIEPGQVPLFEKSGWLLRRDIQFHWENRGYRTFDDFLDALASRKRKAIRKERAAAQEGLSIERLIGADLRPEHWDAFWYFYQDTGSRKWGRPYLTREAFDMLGERMGERILLVMAYDGLRPIAGALNFIGSQALYGRYWGCSEGRRFLHFELCYYQAIEAAIELGLARVEAGAQGQHKIARGYAPVQTTSAHWIADPGFREAVADFLERERQGVAIDAEWLGERTPFRKN
jgi:predicted N-acyltransferase